MGYESLRQRLDRGDTVLLDGGTGTELERRGVTMDPEAWCGPATLHNADVLEGIHRDYIRAGADVITANTYASSRLMLEPAGHGDRVEQINRSAVETAQRARDASGRKDVLVAGSLSHMYPLATASDRPDRAREPAPQTMRAAFHELAFLLRDAGCDLILLEMLYDPHRIELVLESALATGLPVWAGFAVRRNARGEIVAYAPDRSVALAELIEPLRGSGVQAAGLMHSSADLIHEGSVIFRERFDGPLLAYPDSGYFRMPHWHFENVIEPEVLVDFARDWVDAGVQILGGCCGLSPRHIAALHEAFP